MISHQNSESRHRIIFRILMSFLIVFILIYGFNPFNPVKLNSKKVDGVTNTILVEQMDLCNDSVWLPISSTLETPIKVSPYQDHNQSIQMVEYDLLTKTEKREEFNDQSRTPCS